MSGVERQLGETLAEVERPSLAALSVPGVEFSYTQLVITDPELPFEVYAEVCRAAGRFKTATSWWIGDLLNFGEKLYGDRYVDAMEATGLSYETLTNYASVCRKVARSRRRDSLRFGHHAEVASLEPLDQVVWLDAAVANRWTRQELRERLRNSRSAIEPPEQPRWSDAQPASTEPLSPEKVEEAETDARKTLDRPLPPGHPLWETRAATHARDVVALAATVEAPSQNGHVSVPREAIERLLADATLIPVPEDDRDEEGNALVGLVLREPIYGVSREALEEVAALAGYPKATSEEKTK